MNWEDSRGRLRSDPFKKVVIRSGKVNIDFSMFKKPLITWGLRLVRSISGCLKKEFLT